MLDAEKAEITHILDIYEQLMAFNGRSVAKTRIACEQELGVDFTDQWWDEAVYTTQFKHTFVQAYNFYNSRYYTELTI